MPSVMATDMLVVHESDIGGRGVFARMGIAAGAPIETCPVLRVPRDQLPHLDETAVYNYYFAWGEDGAIAFGFGSMYNHSSEPNARYEKDLEHDELGIFAVKDIAAGDEITLNYGWSWEEQR